MVSREERRREQRAIRQANRTNRRGRAPSTRNNRILIRDNRRTIEGVRTDITRELVREIDIAPREADQTIGIKAFNEFSSRGLPDTEEYVERLNFATDLGGGDTTPEASTFVANLSDELFKTNKRAQETTENVTNVTNKSNQALNNTLLIASASIGALGGALDSANSILLQAVFLGIQTVRTIAATTSTISAGISLVVGGAAVTLLVIQSYKIRQNRQQTANQLGQAGASLQALAVIGSAF